MSSKVNFNARIGVLADFSEENWPSMDLVAKEMAGEEENGEDGFVRKLVQPAMRRRFSTKNNGVGYTADRLVNRFFDYPRFLKTQSIGFDLFHLADHSYGQLLHVLPPDCSVVTCHDVDTFRCLWEPGKSGRGRLFLAMTRRILSGMQKAAHVACDSQATLNELLAHHIIPAEKLSVVPLGLRSGLLDASDEQTVNRISELLGKNAEQCVDLLHVGSTIERKRIDVLLEVFARVNQKYPNTRLLRVGGPFTDSQQKQVTVMSLSNAIVVLPFLSVAELAEVYRRAAITLLPSDAEGFGFPVIEAMACGTPVVASDLSVLREVGGVAAEYAEVADTEKWVKKIEQLLQERTNNPFQWAARQAASRQQGQQFTWVETRRQMAEIYREVLDRKKYLAGKAMR